MHGPMNIKKLFLLREVYRMIILHNTMYIRIQKIALPASNITKQFLKRTESIKF